MDQQLVALQLRVKDLEIQVHDLVEKVETLEYLEARVQAQGAELGRLAGILSRLAPPTAAPASVPRRRGRPKRGASA